MKKTRLLQKKMMPAFFILTACWLMVLMLSACGGSASDPLTTGIFIDSAVEGLEFHSGNRYGATDADGKFYFKENETTAFFVGGLPIGSTDSPKEITTPVDLVDEPNSFVTHPTVTNICRLLQSLDEDGDPDNGILLSKNIRKEIQSLVDQGLTINFNVTTDAFSAQGDIQTLFTALNAAGVFTDNTNRSLTSVHDANSHFFKGLAAYNITPVAMINLGDELTNGAQSGTKNVHQYTQYAGYTAYISYQLTGATDLTWNNPLLELDGERNFSRILNDDDGLDIPHNLGVAGATTQTLLNEKTGTGNTLLDELLKPIPENSQTEVSQMEAALYLAGLYPNRMKLFTLWIGAGDSLAAATQNGGAELTMAAFENFLDDTVSGHDLGTVKANLTQIVGQLRHVEYGYVFVATLPHVQTLGAFFGKTDIERMAIFDSPAVTTLGENEWIGFEPFIGDYTQVATSVSRALNSDNETLNNTITQIIAQDANFLNEAEVALINGRIDAINAHIRTLAGAYDNVFLVDMETYYDQMATNGLSLDSKTLVKTFGQGFFSLDGVTPSYCGYAMIANEFISAINTAQIGMDIEAIDVSANVLPIDPYNIDTDKDGFFSNPGTIPTILIPIYDPLLKGWIDCNDNDDTVFPGFVSGDDCL
jgi:hypothetical protein